MIVKIKPTPKRNRMAVIIASRHKGNCYFCDSPDTVAVDTINGLSGKSIIIRHKCSRHRLFGYWTAMAWSWE